VRNILLLVFLIPLLFAGCATNYASTTKNSTRSSEGYLEPEPARAEVPMKLPTSPVQMLQLQTIPPKLMPTP
jgi:hypothetical protein